MTTVTIWTFIAILVPALIGLATLVGSFLSWLSKQFKDIGDKFDLISEHLGKQDASIAKVETKVASIEREVFANGGESLRDRIDSTAQDVAALKATLENHKNDDK